MTQPDTGPQSPLDVAGRLMRVIEDGDLEAARSVYSPGVIVWACFDNRERDLAGSLDVLAWLLRATTERRYEIVRRIEIEGGVLQQHVLHGTTRTGKTFAMPVCLVMQFDGDRISRVDEYLDPAAVAAALG